MASIEDEGERGFESVPGTSEETLSSVPRLLPGRQPEEGIGYPGTEVACDLEWSCGCWGQMNPGTPKLQFMSLSSPKVMSEYSSHYDSLKLLIKVREFAYDIGI
ncbi:hypothetical protein STEG23_008575, partial [Scotinomys teguina]